MKKLYSIIALLLVSAAFVSCVNKDAKSGSGSDSEVTPSKTIVGTWNVTSEEAYGANMLIELDNDNTGKITFVINGISQHTDKIDIWYYDKDKNVLSIVSAGAPGEIAIKEGSVDGDKLECEMGAVNAPYTSKITMTRVK